MFLQTSGPISKLPFLSLVDCNHPVWFQTAQKQLSRELLHYSNDHNIGALQLVGANLSKVNVAADCLRAVS